ncbi:MAG: T9SS type A sorting domain-containing protein [candidate division WOR-3 bacterium]|nr:T9SS type A sorting domain-containing protein [candidate division WOR-3 bacterium]
MKLRSRNVYLVGLILLLSVATQGISSVSSDGDAVFQRITENGPIIVREPGLPNYGGSGMPDDPAVVWSYNLTDAIYNTTCNTVDGYVFAGTYLNNPWEAELFAPTGGGIPEWVHGGTEFYTDAGDNVFTLAAVDEEGGGVNVIKWTGPGNGTPDWTTNFIDYAVASYGPCVVSDDGSTIAAIAAPAGTDAHLLLFDADSATPLIDYTATGCGFPRYVKINADGRYTAFIALATLIVFDRDSLNVRAQIPMGASNSALDISGDGNLVAYGWPSLVLMEWNGSSYQNLWSYTVGGGYYLSKIAISNDGSTMVSCWYIAPHNTFKVVVHDTGSSTPLWIYDYPVSSGTYQEVCFDIDITDDGSYFIIGSWGDDANINPEVHIFQRDATPHIYYTVDMPGSMFSVDISNDGSYATAAGKHVHANAMGRGGDIVLINTGITGIDDNNFTGYAGDAMQIACYPNPFTYSTAIRYSITTGDKETQVKIYDAAGKLVKSLYPVSSSQNQVSAVFWDGTDRCNRQLSGGVYFVRLETENSSTTEKIVKLE